MNRNEVRKNVVNLVCEDVERHGHDVTLKAITDWNPLFPGGTWLSSMFRGDDDIFERRVIAALKNKSNTAADIRMMLSK